MKNFDNLFVSRTSSILMKIDLLSLSRESRIGGMPPEKFNDITKYELSDFYYLFTLGDDFSHFINKKNISIFIPKDYHVRESATVFPELKIKCLIHDPCAASSSCEELVYPGITPSSLIKIERDESIADEEYGYLIKIGSSPYLLQDESYFYNQLDIEDYKFVFQFDENGLIDDVLKGDYPFGFGAVYFYGFLGRDEELIHEIVAGFWQK